ncbi:MAG TPA: hypothetical protein VGN63_01395 [Flavisolibacter sp.]|jgi:hypothetical protein|nr:hypothetical protein [Flavisolibacter sp.]
MTVEEAKQELTSLRKKQRELQKRLETLLDFLQEKGVETAAMPEKTARNQALYSSYLRGHTYTNLAKHFQLSTSRVRQICMRMQAKRD